jgi:hypothetical protein
MAEVKALNGGSIKVTTNQQEVLDELTRLRDRVLRGEVHGACIFLCDSEGLVIDSEIPGACDGMSLHMTLHRTMIDLASDMPDNNDA